MKALRGKRQKPTAMDVAEENASLSGRISQLFESVGPRSAKRGCWGDTQSAMSGKLAINTDELSCGAIETKTVTSAISHKFVDRTHFITSLSAHKHKDLLSPQSLKTAPSGPKFSNTQEFKRGLRGIDERLELSENIETEE